MSETPDGRPRPTPRPRPGGKPSPRPRVAGSRRERDEADTRVEAVARPEATARPDRGGVSLTKSAATARPRAPRATKAPAATPASGRRLPALALVLALLCLAAAAGGGYLLWQRLNPAYVDSSIFAAARDGVQALYAYDYEDSEGSVQGKLDVLTGELRDQYEEDLAQGGIIDTYEQVSATTSYEVLEVGLQQVNDAQDTATLVVFGQYVVKSVNSGDQAAPEGSECLVTPEGAQSCTQTVRVRVVQVDGDWKIDELTLLTTS
jgi:co-chaperonin GroES (HSP10)